MMNPNQCVFGVVGVLPKYKSKRCPFLKIFLSSSSSIVYQKENEQGIDIENETIYPKSSNVEESDLSFFIITYLINCIPGKD